MSACLRINREKFLQSIFEEKEILKEVYQAFRDDAARVRRDMASAEIRENLLRAARIMHALKGILSSVADFEDAAEAEALEKLLESRVTEEEENLLRERMDTLCKKLPEVEEELRKILGKM